EAVIKGLVVVDVKAGGLFVMERAAGAKLPARTFQLHRLSDQRRQQGAGAQLVEELGRKAHATKLPSRVREGLRVGRSASAWRMIVKTPSIRSKTSSLVKRITR